MPDRIDFFVGDYEFLSNYFKRAVRINGLLFPTNEHAFAAFKTTDLAMRAAIAALPTPGAARAVGRSRKPIIVDGVERTLVLRSDWEQIKDDVMRRLVHAKFTQHPDLCDLLIATGEAELFEGTAYDITGHLDVIWGINFHTGVGENRLGKTLMGERTVQAARRLLADTSAQGAFPRS